MYNDINLASAAEKDQLIKTGGGRKKTSVSSRAPIWSARECAGAKGWTLLAVLNYGSVTSYQVGNISPKGGAVPHLSV